MDMGPKNEGQTEVQRAGLLITKSGTENEEGVHRQACAKYQYKSVN
jgi:hypothetical protein